MDQILNKVGSYWIGQKANKELNSVGDEINSLTSSIQGGSKWLVNKLKGTVQKPLSNVLEEYGMAVGIFPRDATHYEFDEDTGKLVVYVPSVCEVGYGDGSTLRFSEKVTGYLRRGQLSEVEGVKTKAMMMWQKVTSVSVDPSGITFSGRVKRVSQKRYYDVSRDGIPVDKF